MTPDACPSPADVLLLLDADPADAAIERHVDGCARCAAILQDAAVLLARAGTVFTDEDEGAAVAAEHAVQRQQLARRVQAGLSGTPHVDRPPVLTRPPWWRRWWALPVTCAGGVAATAAIVFGLLPLSVAAKTIERVMEAEARVSAASLDDRGWHAQAMPEPRAGTTPCAPWHATLPDERARVPPGAGAELLRAFVADSGATSPFALAARYQTWYQSAARFAPDEAVQDDGGVRVVSTAAPAGGPLQRAELTSNRHDDRIVRVTLIGAGCRVVITPVRDGPASSAQ